MLTPFHINTGTLNLKICKMDILRIVHSSYRTSMHYVKFNNVNLLMLCTYKEYITFCTGVRTQLMPVVHICYVHIYDSVPTYTNHYSYFTGFM